MRTAKRPNERCLPFLVVDSHTNRLRDAKDVIEEEQKMSLWQTPTMSKGRPMEYLHLHLHRYWRDTTSACSGAFLSVHSARSTCFSLPLICPLQMRFRSSIASLGRN